MRSLYKLANFLLLRLFAVILDCSHVLIQRIILNVRFAVADESATVHLQQLVCLWQAFF